MSVFSNWFSGKQKPVTQLTPLQAQRAKQIEQLKICFKNALEISRDVEYRVSTLIKGNTLYLYITLPPKFPEELPQIRITPKVQHPWVDSQSCLTSCPLLNNFTVHTSLGRVVTDILEEFQKNPPVLVGQELQTTSGSSVPSPPYSSISTYYSNAMVPHGKGLELTRQIPQIHDMSDNDLEKLLADEDDLNDLVLSLPTVQQAIKTNHTLCEVNQLLATSNLTKKPILEQRKRELLEQHDQLNDLRSQFDDFSIRQSSLLSLFSPQAMQDQLRIAAAQAEEEADNIAEDFLQGKISLDEFKKLYLEKRTLSHLRKIKEEKFLTGLLRTVALN